MGKRRLVVVKGHATFASARLLVCTLEAGIVIGVVDLDSDRFSSTQCAYAVVPSDFTLVLHIQDNGAVYERDWRFCLFSGDIDVDLFVDLITATKNKGNVAPRICSQCDFPTPKRIPVCIECHWNRHCEWLFWAQMIPLVSRLGSLVRTFP